MNDSEATKTTAPPAPYAWPATRAEGLRRLADFLPHAGRDYAGTRNADRGPDDRTNVSTLAPYVRTRRVTEEEIVRAVLGRFTMSGAEKFVQEVFWRTYWKGWLEARPAAWHDYLDDVRRGDAELAREDTARAYAEAIEGKTGIDAFDAWARELVEIGYLHNHARMWFASIWIFTLRLPWALGADFFLKHLLCGDQASNTLSWRWVAGLHTVGKNYVAGRENIRRYTDGRFDVGTRLASNPRPLEGRTYAPGRLPDVPLVVERPEPALLVLHDDDTGVESLALDGLEIRATFGANAARGRSPREVAEPVIAYTRDALADALATAPHGDPAAIVETHDTAAFAAFVIARARACDAKLVVVPFAPVGPARDAFDTIAPALRDAGLRVAEVGRRYDALAWPFATRGFFGLKDKIPTVLRGLEIDPRTTR